MLSATIASIMGIEDYIKFLAALIFVLSLMGGLAFALKKLGLSQNALGGSKNKRLKISEVLPIDARRKLVLMRQDDKEHLVLLSSSGDTVIKTDINPAANEVAIPGKSDEDSPKN